MISGVLRRFSDDGKRTLGELTLTAGSRSFVLATLEEAWNGNKNDVSCIPVGTYKVVPHGWNNEPVRVKNAYRLTGTGARAGILIHSGNTTMDIEGCILVGLKHGRMAGMDAVLQSRPAMQILRDLVGRSSFKLTIQANEETSQ